MLDTLRHVASAGSLWAITAKEKMHDFLTEELGEDFQYAMDWENRLVRFYSDRGEFRARPHMVASIAIDPPTYLWSYAEFFQKQREYSHVPAALEAFALQHRLDDFHYGAHTYLSEGEEQNDAIRRVAHWLGQAAVEVMGPEYTYYISRVPTGNYFVSLIDQWEPAIPAVTLEDVFSKLARLLGDGENLEWRLGGLARKLGGGLVRYPSKTSERESLWKLSAADGRFIWIETAFDEHGLLATVRLHGINPPEDAAQA